jgi:hypothetical protein
MEIFLRQVCLVAEELAPVEEDIRAVFGLEVCYRDPGVEQFGLENALFPLGNEFLEVVAPIRGDTAAGRYLKRRGGPGGYMMVTVCDDPQARNAHIEKLGIEVAFAHPEGRMDVLQLHPRATGGTFFEIDWQSEDLRDPDRWMAAGEEPDIASKRRTGIVGGIRGVELQSPTPDALARRWASIACEEVTPDVAGHPSFTLGPVRVHCVPCTDGRPEGLGGVHLEVNDRSALLAAAEKRGLRHDDTRVDLCGTRFSVGLDQPASSARAARSVSRSA